MSQPGKAVDSAALEHRTGQYRVFMGGWCATYSLTIVKTPAMPGCGADAFAGVLAQQLLAGDEPAQRTGARRDGGRRRGRLQAPT